MSNWFTDVQNKLTTMRAYCLNQSSTDCASADVSNSQAAYNAQFDDLEAQINSYKTGSVESRSAQLREIIMFLFTDYMLKDVGYTPPVKQHQPPYPTGYNDLWELFTMDGLASDILSYSDSYYYQACITTPSGTTSNLQADITKATGAEAVDAGLRTALVGYLQSYPTQNALILLTENMTLSAQPKSKQVCGVEMYTNRNAKDIIDTFALTTYVPTYILNP